MGCCQTNLASPNHPININQKNFIDRIKQDGSRDDEGKNKKNNNKKKTQTEEEYQYSVHGLRQQQEDQESSVSIFDQERRLRSAKNSSEGRRKVQHVEIHPQPKIDMQKLNAVKQLIPPLQLATQKNSQTFQPTFQQFPISRIDLLHPFNNLSLQQDHILNKEISSHSLLQQNHDIHEDFTIKDTANAIYNQTDRELVELNQKIATMIVMWDHKKTGEGKMLRLETMKNESDQQSIKQKGKEQNNENVAEEVDKDLQEIWKEEQNKDHIVQPAQQSLNSQAKINKLKNQYILQPNHHQPQSNKPKQSCLLTNKKLKQKLTENQQNSSKPEEKQNKPSQPKQQLKLHLSKMKSRKPQQLNSPQINHQKATSQFQEESENQSEDQYSHCLLSNPSRILNQSFVEEFNLEKQIFYFCDPKSYKKWIQNDRKAFQVKKALIQEYLLGKNDSKNHLHIHKPNHQLSNNLSSFTQTFCTLLSIIRDYHQLTGINLIAYRTFSSTSIFMQPHERELNYSGFRTFFNGTKRIYPFSQCFDCTQIGPELWKMIQKLSENEKNPAELLYNLTGWVPEYIVVAEINSFEGIFQRLNNNFIEGNTIITFSGKRGQSWGLKAINLEKKEITLYGRHNGSQAYKHVNEFEQKHTWKDFTNIISSINVNWNPLIYEYVWKTQNIFFSHQQLEGQPKDLIQELDPQYVADKSHQYLLKIPPSDEDIELRVFLQTHYDDTTIVNDESQPLVVELYDYMGTRVHSSSVAIRKIDKKKAVYSDVLIFQGSKDRTEYVLLVRPQSVHVCSMPQLKYTISAFSFFEVGLSQLAQQRVIQQKLITTYLQQSHCGHGINSPFFLDNFYMQLKVPSNQRVRIFVEMPTDECCFEINLVANSEGQENLTRLNLETILNEIVNSDQFTGGKGYLEIQTKHQEYFLMLTNHTKCKGEFKIVVQLLEKQPKALTIEKLTQIQQINSTKSQSIPPKTISYKQKFFYQQPLAKKQFKWSPLNTGPRKRLKSNTHSDYQPFVTFKQFFKNPYVDFKLQKGKQYQFSVVSQTFKEQFSEIQNQQDKNDAEPPTLSLGILKMARPDEYDDSEKGGQSGMAFKIVLDDAFYVPFGFGFWTRVMEFEEGDYRFVFPRMEKEGGVGEFCVYEIKQ